MLNYQIIVRRGLQHLDLEFRHCDSNGLRIRMTDTDIHALDASFGRCGFGVTMKLHEY